MMYLKYSPPQDPLDRADARTAHQTAILRHTMQSLVSKTAKAPKITDCMIQWKIGDEEDREPEDNRAATAWAIQFTKLMGGEVNLDPETE